jgi:hypothetical protein
LGFGFLGERGERETNPFSIAVLVLLVRAIQIHAIESADGEREDDLDEAEDGV